MSACSFRHRAGSATALAFGLALAGAAPEPASSAGLAACSAIAADAERLACYDRLSGRAANTASEAASVPMSAPPAAPASASPAPLAGAAVAAGAASLLDSAWGFNPDSGRYLIRLYRPNYLQLARYSSNPNAAPFDLDFNSVGDVQADINDTEAKFQLSFKTRLRATADRRFGVWAAYTQQS
jgi:phospholipase A1